MPDNAIDFDRLRAPFPAEDIEWRVMQAGKGDKGIWAKALAYVTSRAIMERLDEVCGPANWQTAFRMEGTTLAAGIGVKVGDEWVWKWDGAGHLAASDGLSESDAGKGDYSNAMKRAGYQWGIGRYLYRLSEGWANVHQGGANYAKLPKKEGGGGFRWDPPALPAWALPEGGGKPTGKQAPKPQAPASQPSNNAPDPKSSGAPQCPSCEASEVWDNREKKASGKFSAKSPDYSCKDKDGCGWVLWVDAAKQKLTKAIEGLAITGTVSAESAQERLQAIEDGELGALRSAQDWVRQKQDEAKEAQPA